MECVVGKLVLLLGHLGQRNELDVLLGGSANLGSAIAGQFDSCPSIVTDNIASDVGFCL